MLSPLPSHIRLCACTFVDSEGRTNEPSAFYTSTQPDRYNNHVLPYLILEVCLV